MITITYLELFGIFVFCILGVGIMNYRQGLKDGAEVLLKMFEDNAIKGRLTIDFDKDGETIELNKNV